MHLLKQLKKILYQGIISIIAQCFGVLRYAILLA